MKYQFKCPECGCEMEQTMPVERGPVTMWCPDCIDQEPSLLVLMKRVWNAAPVIFRGGGWASKS